ncbi:MAG: hypothetical protein ACI96M_003366, partial [Candidatus Azotimanducaceae bacterium]
KIASNGVLNLTKALSGPISLSFEQQNSQTGDFQKVCHLAKRDDES